MFVCALAYPPNLFHAPSRQVTWSWVGLSVLSHAASVGTIGQQLLKKT